MLWGCIPVKHSKGEVISQFQKFLISEKPLLLTIAIQETCPSTVIARVLALVYHVHMAGKRFTVLDLIDIDLKEHNSLNLRCCGGRRGLSREIAMADLNRPGLALSGFFDSFAFQRIQIFGRGEVAYLTKLSIDKKTDTIEQLLAYAVPCCIFTHNLEPTEDFFSLAEKNECPILQTDLSSSEFSSRILRVLSNLFAPQKSVDGVLVEVYGVGILILGDSGVGKSETALELIERGHRLVADDVVDIRCVNGNVLMGAGANKLLGTIWKFADLVL
jgi:HPr kinase/phosphorylase